MQTIPFDSIIYLIIVTLAAAAGITRWRLLLLPDRILVVLLLCTVLQEFSTQLAQTFFGDNMLAYLIYSPLELALWGFYFQTCLPQFRRRLVGIVIGTIAVVAGVFIPLYTTILDSFAYYLLLEYTILILMCLGSFYLILIQEDRRPSRLAHFWILFCLLLYCSVNFTSCGFYNYLEGKQHKGIKEAISTINIYSNIIFYAAVSIIFIRYRKLIPSGA